MKMLSNPTTNQLISSLFHFNDWKISTIFYQKILQYFYCCHHRRRHRYRRKQYLLIDDHNNNNNNNEYNNDGNDNFINHHHHYCQTFKSSMFMLKHPWQTLCFIIQIFILIDIINRFVIDLIIIGNNHLMLMNNDNNNYQQYQPITSSSSLMILMFGMVNAQQQQQQLKCGDLKQCSKMFREATLSHNLSYDLSSDKIERICVKLNRAVNCFKNYRSMCINDNIHNSKIITDFYDQMSEGPLGLTMELCNNTKFKQDYLTLGPCQKKYRGEFDRCLTMNQGNQITQNDSNSTILEQFIEHCCALHNYHNCIYDISLDKCGKDAAEFSLKILELFNRNYLRECAKYANLSHLCSNRFSRSNATNIHLLWSSITIIITATIWSFIICSMTSR